MDDDSTVKSIDRVPWHPSDYRIMVDEIGIWRVRSDYSPEDGEMVVPQSNTFFYRRNGMLAAQFWAVPRRFNKPGGR